MNNDSILILNELYREKEINVFSMHTQYRIPPTMLYMTLEHEKIKGNVTRDGLNYYLTERGEKYFESELVRFSLKPAAEYKIVPDKYVSPRADFADTGVVSII